MSKLKNDSIPYISDDLQPNAILMVFLTKFEDVYDRKDLLGKIQVILGGLEQQPNSGCTRTRSQLLTDDHVSEL
jgi:hypothetical protein